MKKNLLLTVFLITGGLVFGQETFFEDFNDTLPDTWTIIDGGHNPGTWEYSESYGLDGTGCVSIDTYEGDSIDDGRADDWLISPQITVQEGDVLSFWANADAEYPDSLGIYISKTGTEEADFTIHVDEVIVQGDFAKYSFNLTDLPDVSAEDEIHIGIHCETNGSYVDIDDFRVGKPSELTLFEDFEDGIPSDWTVVDAGENLGTWDTVPEVGLDESVGLELDCYEDTLGPANDWLITPQFEVKEDEILSFYAECNPNYPDEMRVLVSKNSSDTTDFDIVLFERFEISGSYFKYTYNLTDHPELSSGDMIYVALVVDTYGSRVNVDNFRVGPYVAPSVMKAYSISNDEIEVQFDSPVNPDSIDVADYVVIENDSEITFSDFSVDEDDQTLVTLTGASSSFENDITVDTLRNIPTEEEYTFYAGILPLTYTSLTNPDGTIEFDAEIATFKGIVTLVNEPLERVWIQDDSGAHHGVNTYNSDTSFAETLDVGDEILINGSLSPYQNQTEIYPAELIEVLSTGNNLYDPVVIGADDIATTVDADSDPAEQYEGVLVTVESVKVSDNFDGAYFTCEDEDGNEFYVGDVFSMYDGELDDSFMAEDTEYNITGIVVNRGGEYVLVPRNDDDLEEIVANSVDDENKTGEIYTFPNPVQNELRIMNAPQVTEAEIYNSVGTKVKSVKFNNHDGVINTRELKTGVYFITVYQGNEKVKTMKIIKE